MRLPGMGANATDGRSYGAFLAWSSCKEEGAARCRWATANVKDLYAGVALITGAYNVSSGQIAAALTDLAARCPRPPSSPAHAE